jgi:hypothetical protein
MVSSLSLHRRSLRPASQQLSHCFLSSVTLPSRTTPQQFCDCLQVHLNLPSGFLFKERIQSFASRPSYLPFSPLEFSGQATDKFVLESWRLPFGCFPNPAHNVPSPKCSHSDSPCPSARHRDRGRLPSIALQHFFLNPWSRTCAHYLSRGPSMKLSRYAVRLPSFESFSRFSLFLALLDRTNRLLGLQYWSQRRPRRSHFTSYLTTFKRLNPGPFPSV